MSADEILDSKEPGADLSEYWRGTGTDKGYTATGLLARLYMDGQPPFEDYDLGLGLLQNGAKIKDSECR